MKARLQSTRDWGTGHGDGRPRHLGGQEPFLPKAHLENETLTSLQGNTHHEYSQITKAVAPPPTTTTTTSAGGEGPPTTWTPERGGIWTSSEVSAAPEGAAAAWSYEKQQDGPEASVVPVPTRYPAVPGLGDDRGQDDQGDSSQAPSPHPPGREEGWWASGWPREGELSREEGGKRVGGIGASGPAEGCERGWSSGGRRRFQQLRPHPPQKRLRNPSQPVTGHYSSSRTLPSCPHSWSLLSDEIRGRH